MNQEEAVEAKMGVAGTATTTGFHGPW